MASSLAAIMSMLQYNLNPAFERSAIHLALAETSVPA